MSRRTPFAVAVMVLVIAGGAKPAFALAGGPASLPTLEQAWHSCVREAFDQQPMHMSKPGGERNALDEYKPHEDAYVAALMAPRPDADLPMGGWARTWAAYMAFVVDPVKAWIGALRR